MILHRNLVFNVCPKDEGWHVNLLGYSFDGDNSTWIYKVEKRGTKCIISSKTAKSHYHHHGLNCQVEIYFRTGFCCDLMTLFTIFASSTKNARKMLMWLILRVRWCAACEK